VIAHPTMRERTPDAVANALNDSEQPNDMDPNDSAPELSASFRWALARLNSRQGQLDCRE
jgi:hypothetical protein